MELLNSADGTPIAYDVVGDGPAVVIVNGALSRRVDAAELASALADAGFRAFTWDRRARGSSGDSPDRSPEREVEDLAAMIDVAGGDAAVLGHSSGAILALYAASLGVRPRALFLSEPPFRFGDDPPADLDERIQALVDAGDAGEAVALFQLEAIELPEEMVDGFRKSGALDAIAPLGQSTIYDLRLTTTVSTPTPEMLSVGVPITILRGEQTFPFLVAAGDRLAAEMPDAEYVIVPESVMHRADPVGTARVIRDRMR
jgi:pimeloyl-ACP methyl ester carboxylesterase